MQPPPSPLKLKLRHDNAYQAVSLYLTSWCQHRSHNTQMYILYNAAKEPHTSFATALTSQAVRVDGPARRNSARHRPSVAACTDDGIRNAAPTWYIKRCRL